MFLCLSCYIFIFFLQKKASDTSTTKERERNKHCKEKDIVNKQQEMDMKQIDDLKKRIEAEQLENDVLKSEKLKLETELKAAKIKIMQLESLLKTKDGHADDSNNRKPANRVCVKPRNVASPAKKIKTGQAIIADDGNNGVWLGRIVSSKNMEWGKKVLFRTEEGTALFNNHKDALKIGTKQSTVDQNFIVGYLDLSFDGDNICYDGSIDSVDSLHKLCRELYIKYTES